MSKSLLEKMEEAIRRPVPYEGLRVEPREANVSHGERRRAPISAPSPEENPNYLEDSFPWGS